MGGEYYLFICSLFNKAVSNSDYIASNGRLAHNELAGMWNDVVVG